MTPREIGDRLERRMKAEAESYDIAKVKHVTADRRLARAQEAVLKADIDGTLAVSETIRMQDAMWRFIGSRRRLIAARKAKTEASLRWASFCQGVLR